MVTGCNDWEMALDSSGAENKTENNKQKTYNILVAEDNLMNQELISEILEMNNQNFKIVDNGKEVLSILSEEQFDLILMDGRMPIMDGFEATRKVRIMEKGSGKHMPIIALTASALIGEKDDFLEAGMDDYIRKPLDIDELFKVINRFLKNKERSNESYLPNDANRMAAIPEKKTYLDKETLLDKYTGYLNVLVKIIDNFFKFSPNMMNKIDNDVKTVDFNSLKINAHSFKGSIGFFYVNEAVELLIEIEAKSCNEDISAIRQLHLSLKEVVEKVLVELEEIKEEICRE